MSNHCSNKLISRSTTSYLATFASVLSQASATDGMRTELDVDSAGERIVEMILRARASGRKVLLVGNGGSAAIMSHLHNDLTKAVGVRAMVFNEPALLSALANDEGYESVFERPVDLWADQGDVLIAISSSGRSENILAAVRTAVTRGCSVVTLSGFSASNPLRRMGHINLYVPSDHYGMVEQGHSVLTHYFSDAAAAAGVETLAKETLAS